MEKLNSLVSRVLFASAFALLGIALCEALINAFGYTVLRGIYTAGRLLEFSAVLLVFVIAWVVGDNLKVRRAYMAELEAKAFRNEAQKRADAERAVIEERTRIARELHDVVAHSMSVMVVQAGAARRVLGDDTDRAEEAIAQIETTGRESLTEMRRMLGALRNDDDDQTTLSPQPGLADIRQIVEQCSQNGVRAELDLSDTLPALPPGQDITAYRIVQEGLTNAAKHGDGPVELVTKWSGDGLTITIENRVSARSDSSGAGLGLIGICHLPLQFGARVAIILVATIPLVTLRADFIESDWLPVIWPILGSMFMSVVALNGALLAAERAERAVTPAVIAHVGLVGTLVLMSWRPV